MRKYFESCEEKEDDFVGPLCAKISYLRIIRFEAKWKSIREKPLSKQRFMDHVIELNGLSTLLFGIPPRVQESINTVVSITHSKLKSNKINWKGLDPMELGESVAKRCKEDDLEELSTKARTLVHGVEAIRKAKRKDLQKAGISISDLDTVLKDTKDTKDTDSSSSSLLL